MLDLAMLARRLRTHECTLHLRDAQPHVRTVIEQVGLHRLPSVILDGSAPALAY
jgi:anti-anti-sigma regulatory factor